MISLFGGMLLNDSGYMASPSLMALMAAAIVCGCILVTVYPWSYAKEQKESRMGYTTYPRHRKNLAQVDPKTGRIVRSANEPFLDRATRQARLSKLRSSEFIDG